MAHDTKTDTFFSGCHHFSPVFPGLERHEKGPESLGIPGFYGFYRLPPVMNLAEREGFEPSVENNPHTRLAGEHHRPTRSSLQTLHRGEFCGGGSRIRTHGAFAQRFSRPPPSTARPSLPQRVIYTILKISCQPTAAS